MEGEVTISGSKNASLPIIAATILNQGKSTLYNVPKIHDVDMMYEILRKLGGSVTKKHNKVIIDTTNINKYEIPEDLMRQMRSSVILVGGLIGVHKKAVFSYPGGCDIGTRPIDLHLDGFEKLGINIDKNYGNISCSCDRIVGEKISLDFPSVGATENIMLASCMAEGTTVISNAAREPEIIDLQKFLNKMGAKIKGAGTDEVVIEGVKNLKDVSYNIMPDRIEAGTFLCMAAMTNGTLTLKHVEPNHIKAAIDKLEEMGCKFEIGKTEITIKGPKRLKCVNIKTMPYPGFPTDMQSVMGAALTTARGSSMIVENLFENRYKYTGELVRMGAKITVEGRTAVIKGVRRLDGAKVEATDLRGGAALVIAAVAAKGTTTIDNIKYILRGYENLEHKLKCLHIDIKTEGV